MSAFLPPFKKKRGVATPLFLDDLGCGDFHPYSCRATMSVAGFDCERALYAFFIGGLPDQLTRGRGSEINRSCICPVSHLNVVAFSIGRRNVDADFPAGSYN